MTDNKLPEHNINYSVHEDELDISGLPDAQRYASQEEPTSLLDPRLSTQPNVAEQSKPRNVKKYITRSGLGLLAVGGIFALATQPENVLHEAEKAAPITLPGIVASEVLWDVGAGLMVVGAGKNIGNPLTLRNRWAEVGNQAANSSLTKAGLTINTVGALAFTGFLVYGGTKLSPDLWPGVGGVAGVDLASTIAIRAPIVLAIKNASERQSSSANIDLKSEKKRITSVKVRHAKLDDINRLAEIDLQLFKKAYGQETPSHQEVADMLEKRYLNNPDWMFVSEIDGKVEGFVSAFRTNVPSEDFVSWEQSTADGTLDGRVDPKGKYAYVTNMTIKSEAVRLGAEGMLLANLFANGIEEGLEYGYFISRVPYFKRWLKRSGMEPSNAEEFQLAAEAYVNARRRDGTRRDPELRIYEKLGYSLERTVSDAFQDDASLNFGVICKAEVPPTNKLKNIKPVRLAYATALRQLAKHPKILEKVL